MFGIVKKEKQTYTKSNHKARVTARMSQYIVHSQDIHKNEIETPVTADDIELVEV